MEDEYYTKNGRLGLTGGIIELQIMNYESQKDG